ncbi:YbaY family lipoprotein [Dehalococcoides mccartyi]|nr:YbaY family lipoprotein [Dehalococcoides mccartyi]
MKKSNIIAFTLVAALLMAFAACSNEIEPTPTTEPVVPTVEPTEVVEISQSSVVGTITYAQEVALNPDAVVTVKLLDVSRADAPSITLGEQIIENPGQAPVSFKIDYNEDDIDSRFSYSVRAEIREDGRLLFTIASSYPVITRDNPTEVHLVLEKVGE